LKIGQPTGRLVLGLCGAAVLHAAVIALLWAVSANRPATSAPPAVAMVFEPSPPSLPPAVAAPPPALAPPEPAAANLPVAPTRRPRPAPPRLPEKNPPLNSIPTAPAPPAIDRAASQAAFAAWQSALAEWLQSHKTYPEAARRDRAQGRVLIRFTVDRNGHVTDVALESSSGSPILDTAAQTMLRGAVLPALPASLPQNELILSIPIRFSLQP
jgi:protein TonB